ncbi:VCBS repeat-containing protein [Streptomyces sp. NPDC046182]|uniref:FG-GAP repeat domain-containing protein n=1 Tax=Streptomyces sp. NPDC046182 TaxID=3154601 RepID=UPI0033CD5A12
MPDGKIVIAVSTKPLTGPAGDGAGVPAGFIAQQHGCEEVAGLVAVYVCRYGQHYPRFLVPDDAADLTTVHWGFAFVPRGGDLASGIEEARTAGARPTDATHGAATLTVKTREHAERNTVDFNLPTLPAGKTVRQELRFHANDAGRMGLVFRLAEGEVQGGIHDIRFGGLTTDSGAACTYQSAELYSGMFRLNCTLEPGDHTISYELTASADVRTGRFEARTIYDIYTSGSGNDWRVYNTGTFSTQGRTVLPRHFLLARDTSGRLFQYDGTRKATAPLNERDEIGIGWQTYNTLAKLSPGLEDLHHVDNVKPSAVTRGRGDVVGRDASGTLWYYDRQFGGGSDTYSEEPYALRVRVGSGWNIYNQLTGAGDVNRDGFMDLLARDKTGVLWLYQGTGNLTSGARFKTRVTVGGGWAIYNQVAAGDDVTGDGKADLLARDASGTLWLYKGTGKATTPYTARTRVGGGWNAYNQLVVTGDLTDDGKADAVARDTTGVLWLYKGTGNATTPFTTRTKIGGGWNTYNRLF